MVNDKTEFQLETVIDKPVLKIESENGTVFSFKESSLPLLIGRDPGCDICIPQSYVSRRHCELYLEYDVLFLRDISTNGTIVSGRSIKGESLLMEGSNRVDFNGKAVIHITACSVDEKSEAKRSSSERRESDRRSIARRDNVTVVDFDRRLDETRRYGARRVGARR